MKQAFVYLRNENLEELEWVLTDSAKSSFVHGRGPLDSFSPVATGHQVIGVVVSDRVLLTHTDLEFTQASKLRKAVPYALEEAISEDVDSLHFALGKIESGNTEVAVINDQLLKTWKNLFTDAGITLRAIVPDLLLLPHQDQAWSLMVSDEQALVRTGEFSGFSCEREGLEELIMAILDTEEMPSSITVWYCGDSPRPMKWSSAAPPVTTPPCPDGSLGLFAAHWDPRHSFNLLQGGHSGDHDVAKLLKPWRWAAVLLMGWISILFAGQVLERNELKSRQTAINQQMESIYRSTFPDARKVVNPRVQMEQRLRELKGGGDVSDADFMPLLAQSSSVFDQHKGVTLEGVNFRKGRLTLNVSGKNLSDLDNLKSAIASSSKLKTELAAADSGAGKATAQIRIQAK